MESQGGTTDAAAGGRSGGEEGEGEGISLAGRWYAEEEDGTGRGGSEGGGVVRGGRFHAVDCWTCSSTPVKAAFGHSPAYAPSVVVLPSVSPRFPDFRPDHVRERARARDRDIAHLYDKHVRAYVMKKDSLILRDSSAVLAIGLEKNCNF